MFEPAEVILVKDQYKMAYHALSRGLTAEERGKKPEALEYYRKGLLHLQQGIEVPTSGERHQGAVWDAARLLQQRMQATLSTVSLHITDLHGTPLTPQSQKGKLLKDLPPDFHPVPPPHPKTPSQTGTKAAPVRPPLPVGLPRRTHSTPAKSPPAMANSDDRPPPYSPLPTSGHGSSDFGLAGDGKKMGVRAGEYGNELLFVSSGVQLFFVAPNGQVSSLTHPGYLRVIAFDTQHQDVSSGSPPAFLDVCNWWYPLTRETPVLLANSGIYMFPDTLASAAGSFVGIVLSSELPDASKDMFKDLMTQLSEFRIQGPDGSEVICLSEKVPLGPLTERNAWKEKPLLPGWSEKMGHGILTGATRLSVGLIKGAEATERAIQKGGIKIRSRMTPEETPTEVNPNVHKGLNAAKTATGGAVRVSKYLVTGLSNAMGHVAEKMAPHVKKHGAKLVPESLKSRKEGEASNVDGAKFVAASSMHGFSTVWSSLETGAKLVGKSLAAETVNSVTYKYGDDAGKATDTGLQSAINVGATAFNIDNLGVKAILKTGGKQMAKAMVKSSGEEKKEDEKNKSDVKNKEEEEKKG
ncbi:spartin-like isoform 1-T1 [Synchiropus picturatus]